MTNMLDVRTILQCMKCIVVFDMDGVLISYNYGKKTAHHEYDIAGNQQAMNSIDIYKNARGIPVIKKYIDSHQQNTYYCLSKEPHGLEESKSNFANKYYNIQKSNCNFVKMNYDKIQVLDRLSKTAELPLVYIDDNDEVLRKVEEMLPNIYTAHVTIFFE